MSYLPSMNTAFDLMDKVLELPRSDRSYLAAKIIESLDREDELSAEWKEELQRRMENYRSGQSVAIDSEHLHAEIKQRFGT